MSASPHIFNQWVFLALCTETEKYGYAVKGTVHHQMSLRLNNWLNATKLLLDTYKGHKGENGLEISEMLESDAELFSEIIGLLTSQKTFQEKYELYLSFKNLVNEKKNERAKTEPDSVTA